MPSFLTLGANFVRFGCIINFFGFAGFYIVRFCSLVSNPANPATMNRIAILMAAAATVAAAMSGATPPDVLTRPMPTDWGVYGAPMAEMPSDDPWWKGFNDPVLDSLISRAESANFDLVQASRRMDAARRQVEIARAAFYPTVGVQASYGYGRAGGSNAQTYGLGASLGWEIDLFGKISEKVSQSKAGFNASRAAYAAAMVSLCGQVASTYIDLRVTQAQLFVARRHILRQDTIAGLARARYDCGLASKIDLDQALSVLYSTRAAVPALEASITADINALALLLGVYPHEAQRLREDTGMPEYRHIIAAGVPAELLRRRPDILQAEYTLDSDAAALGLARKDYLPSLSLQGSVGLQGNHMKGLFEMHNATFSVGPTLSWTVFDGMARRAAVQQARDQMEADVAAYNSTVMGAYNEVSGALEAYNRARQQVDAYEQCVAVGEELLKLSLDLYTQGLTEFTNVANAQVDLLSYNNQLIVARGTALNALVTLYRALGGGFPLSSE